MTINSGVGTRFFDSELVKSLKYCALVFFVTLLIYGGLLNAYRCLKGPPLAAPAFKDTSVYLWR
jgi:hypothetical protein